MEDRNTDSRILVSAVFEIRCIKATEGAQLRGDRLRAAFLDFFPRYLSDVMKAGAARVYTLSPVYLQSAFDQYFLKSPELTPAIYARPGNDYCFRATLLANPAADWLVSSINHSGRHILAQSRFFMADTREHYSAEFMIEDICFDQDIRPGCFAIDAEQSFKNETLFLDQRSGESVTLVFASPTRFHEGDENITLPIPEKIFSSIANSWHPVFGRFLASGDSGFDPPPGFNDFVKSVAGVSRNVVVSSCDHMSKRISQQKFDKRGFTGVVKLDLNEVENRWDRLLLHRLADFSFLSGAGYGRTAGMGQVWPLVENAT